VIVFLQDHLTWEVLGSASLQIDQLTGIGDDGGVVSLTRRFALSQNYPNPFNPSTTIRYDIPVGKTSVPVQVFIYDIRGRLIEKLVDSEKNPGRYQVHWNGRDGRGQSVASGGYLYRIDAGDFSSTKKMVLVR